MRKDMHKVIVERARRGGGSSKGRTKSGPLEDMPTKESMKRRHFNRKELNENLSPLVRFLDSRVGQLWDKVFSEACEVIKPSSTVKNHVKVHMLEMVERKTYMENGKIYYHPKWFFGFGPHPIELLQQRHFAPFYVHPKTGILCKAAHTRRVRHTERQQAKPAETHKLIDGKQAFKIKGIWYFVETLDRESLEFPNRKTLDHPGVRGMAYIISKMALNSKQLKVSGLKNDICDF